MGAATTGSEVQFRNDFKVELVDSMGDDYAVVHAARVSTLNDTRETGADRLIKYLLRHGHWSPFEHVTFTFRSEIPIFLARQVMRHRSQAFNEMSMRYTEALPHFFLPKTLHRQSDSMKQGRAEEISAEVQWEMLDDRRYLYAMIWGMYSGEIGVGVAKEQAREMLPVATYTVLYTTMNLRSLIHFVGDRTDATAQSEAQEYAIQIRNAVSDIVPRTLQAWKEVIDERF